MEKTKSCAVFFFRGKGTSGVTKGTACTKPPKRKCRYGEYEDECVFSPPVPPLMASKWHLLDSLKGGERGDDIFVLFASSPFDLRQSSRATATGFHFRILGIWETKNSPGIDNSQHRKVRHIFLLSVCRRAF